MTMVVKFMGAEGAADADSRKTFRLMSDVVEVRFERAGGKARAFVTTIEAETFDVELEGNVYVLSEMGAELASFGVAPIPPAEVVSLDDRRPRPANAGA